MVHAVLVWGFAEKQEGNPVFLEISHFDFSFFFPELLLLLDELRARLLARQPGN